MTAVFDWGKLNAELEREPADTTRDIIIKRAFDQYVTGNSHFEGKNALEMRGYFEIFLHAWLIRETL